MTENSEDEFGMNEAYAHLSDNQNATEIHFSAKAASKFLCFYLDNCVPDDDREQERMKFESLFAKINTNNGQEAGVWIDRSSFDVASAALLRLKAERAQEKLPF